jgi:hypothetical protein
LGKNKVEGLTWKIIREGQADTKDLPILITSKEDGED